MTTTATNKICEGYEPIPGYVLEKMLGRGGFGEVWRASAPGGLKKAVKFVFGTQDQSSASRERRSLERIKGVHHPFLLTLERFEVIDDQLVIVTELADCSLEDVLKRNVDHGSCGIPRESLISYLHDTSDALDYLHQSYQLQHLDIKPGNLLLVGGHVKVADFGLLKDLRDVECSVVGGLTPIYAPPEVFDGRPNMRSDQYSLAVMYQELLTGTRPFSGRTIAQLATQHVHSAPNLDPLPPSDRPVVARALEKNPERRFPTCKAFVDALRNPRERSTAVISCGDDLSSGDTKPAIDGIQGGSPIEDLPQLSTGAPGTNSRAQHHTLVVALGGTGAECLRELRRRAADLHSACPLDFHSALIDTDKATIHSMRVVETSERIPACNAIHTPLRTANEYRQGGTERLSTISRRWIYNVPRSRTTEGMRPLGRLALVDHGPVVTRRLTESIDSLVTASAGGTPSVYVVGSLTGGTSSGMYFDVVHLLRHLLDQAGLEQVDILSMLSTTALQVDPSHPIALHDAQAAITEMRHFLQAANGYPGDVGAGWPSIPAARTPLRDVYVVSGHVSGSQSPPPVQTIAEYIWTDATGAGELLAAARKTEIAEDISIIPPSIRSVGVVPLGNPKRLEEKVLAPAVVRDLLIRWLGLPSKARQKAARLADRVIRRIGLSADSITEAIVQHLPDQKAWDQIQQAVAQLSDQQRQDQTSLAGVIVPAVESMFASGELPPVIVGMTSHLHREMSVCLNDRLADVTTVIECLKLIQEKAVDLLSQLRGEMLESCDEGATSTLLTIAARVIACHQIEQLRGDLKSLQERLDRFTTTLAMAITQASKSQPSESNPWDEMLEPIRSRFDSIVLQLHEAAVNRYLVRSLNDQLTNIDADTMVNELIETTVPFVSCVVEESSETLVSANNPVEQSGSDADSTLVTNSVCRTDSHSQATGTSELPASESDCLAQPLSIEEALAAAVPAMLAFGGLQRLMLVVSTEHERRQFEPRVRDAHQGSLTVAVIPGSTPKLIHEGQQVELTDILSRLTILNSGNTQVTGRLSSRTDIVW